MSGSQQDRLEKMRRKSREAWQRLGAGQTDEALGYFREQTPDPSSVMELGVAYLWIRNYDSAYNHFAAACQSAPRSMAPLYGMAGVAKWCLDDRQEAVNQWRAGLKSQYADGAGGVRLPLLLYCVSVLDPDLVSDAEAKRLLTIRAEDPRVKNWPGALAEFILRRIDEAGLRTKCAGLNELDRATRHWNADFYAVIVAKERGEAADFKEQMRRLCATSPDDFSDATVDDSDFSHLNFLLGRLWREEFFIARHESE